MIQYKCNFLTKIGFKQQFALTLNAFYTFKIKANHEFIFVIFVENY